MVKIAIERRRPTDSATNGTRTHPMIVPTASTYCRRSDPSRISRRIPTRVASCVAAAGT